MCVLVLFAFWVYWFDFINYSSFLKVGLRDISVKLNHKNLVLDMVFGDKNSFTTNLVLFFYVYGFVSVNDFAIMSR